MTDDESGNENSGKKKIIILILVSVLLVVLTICGTLLAVQMLAPKPEILSEQTSQAIFEGEKESKNTKKLAIYFPLKPAIIVNFQARGRQRFMQADISLMARDDDVIRAIELHMPMIRNSLVLKFGEQVYEELQTEEGKELLRQEALHSVQEILKAEIGKSGIEKLLFTNLVIQ